MVGRAETGFRSRRALLLGVALVMAAIAPLRGWHVLEAQRAHARVAPAAAAFARPCPLPHPHVRAWRHPSDCALCMQLAQLGWRPGRVRLLGACLIVLGRVVLGQRVCVQHARFAYRGRAPPPLALV